MNADAFALTDGSGSVFELTLSYLRFFTSPASESLDFGDDLIEIS